MLTDGQLGQGTKWLGNIANKAIVDSIFRPHCALQSHFPADNAFQWGRKPIPGDRRCGLSQTCRRRTEPLIEATGTKSLVKIASVVLEISSRTDRQTHRQTYWLQYFANFAKLVPKISTGWVGCTNVTDRQTTDGRATANSERQREFCCCYDVVMHV